MEHKQSSFDGNEALFLTIPSLMLSVFMDRPTTAASIDRCKLPSNDETVV